MTAVIVAGGSCPAAFLQKIIRRLSGPLFVVGVDRGVRLLKETGIRPDLIVGDFDSVTPAEREEFLSTWPGTLLSPVKDDTDLEHAVNVLREKVPERVILLGATGTRLDHTLTNIRLLDRFFPAGIPAEILDENNRITLREGKILLRRDEQYGKYVSVLPWDEEVTVTMKGFFYPAESLVLKRNMSRGVSNEITEDEAMIFAEGKILLMETKD